MVLTDYSTDSLSAGLPARERFGTTTSAGLWLFVETLVSPKPPVRRRLRTSMPSVLDRPASCDSRPSQGSLQGGGDYCAALSLVSVTVIGYPRREAVIKISRTT